MRALLNSEVCLGSIPTTYSKNSMEKLWNSNCKQRVGMKKKMREGRKEEGRREMVDLHTSTCGSSGRRVVLLNESRFSREDRILRSFSIYKENTTSL